MENRKLNTQAIRREIMQRSGGVCENPWCERPVRIIHHMLHRSTYPALKWDPDVQIGLCEECDQLAEKLHQKKKDETFIYPKALWERALEKANAHDIGC